MQFQSSHEWVVSECFLAVLFHGRALGSSGGGLVRWTIGSQYWVSIGLGSVPSCASSSVILDKLHCFSVLLTLNGDNDLSQPSGVPRDEIHKWPCTVPKKA